MTPAVAERVAARLGDVAGIVAVALGGSRARGDAQPDSDVDLGLYYAAAAALDVAALRALAIALDERHALLAVTAIGEWGPWINGGAWLTIDGQRIDWLYRDLGQVAVAIDECRAGRSRCYYQIGHPHGFHTHVYAAETYYCRPLHDRWGRLAALKAAATPYPPALRRQLVDEFLFEAGFALETSRKSAARGDVFHVTGNLFRAAAALVQVLYALNERYWMNEKGAVAAVDAFPRRPPAFAATVTAVLANPGATPGALGASLDRLAALVDAVRELAR